MNTCRMWENIGSNRLDKWGQYAWSLFARRFWLRCTMTSFCQTWVWPWCECNESEGDLNVSEQTGEITSDDYSAATPNKYINRRKKLCELKCESLWSKQFQLREFRLFLLIKVIPSSSLVLARPFYLNEFLMKKDQIRIQFLNV